MEECDDVGITFSAVSCLRLCLFLCLFTVISCLFVPHLSGHFIINHTTEPRPSQEPLQVCVFSVKMKPHKSSCACLCGSFLLFFLQFWQNHEDVPWRKRHTTATRKCKYNIKLKLERANCFKRHYTITARCKITIERQNVKEKQAAKMSAENKKCQQIKRKWPQKSLKRGHIKTQTTG